MFHRAVVLIAILAGSLFAQNESASLTGVVTDSSGAVVPRVAVRLVNSETGEAYQASSNDSGNYDFPLLKAGRYSLTVEMPASSRSSRPASSWRPACRRASMSSSRSATVGDKVTVEAAAPLVQSETAAVGAVVENKTIVDMPLIDRRGRATRQAQRIHGAEHHRISPQFSMAGGRGNNANWRMDGGNNNNILLGTSGVGFDPPIDSLQEFNVSISDYSAELGRTGGGVIQMTTKSGTNELHGSAYEYSATRT